MRAADFEAVVCRQLKRSEDVLIDKAKEYATDEDRLANFKVAAAVQGISVQEALAGMMAKHTYSVYALCSDDQAHTTAMWDEKITDHINYLILLRAVVEEAHNTPEDEQKTLDPLELALLSGEDPEKVVTINTTYALYAESADNRSYVTRIRELLKRDLHPDTFREEVDAILHVPYKVKDVHVDTIMRAGQVQASLAQLLHRFHVVTVGQYYGFVNSISTVEDELYGWRNIDAMQFKETDEGHYQIVMPDPERL